MPEKTIKYRPYSDDDGNYQPLLDFVRRYVSVLQPGIEVSTVVSNQWSHEFDYEKVESGWQYGSDVGIKVTTREIFEPKALGVVGSSVSVATFGLEEGKQMALTCLRLWYDPRYLEMHVQGSKAAIDEIAAAFEQEFGQDQPMTAEQLERESLNAEISIKAGAWDAAEMQARSVLKQDPKNGQALFCLGVALAAKGSYDEAREYLQASVVVEPQHYDAWYNLGNASIEQGRYGEAVEQLRQALKISPDNHPAFYRLGVALEKEGKRDKAIAAYRDAVRTAPNPGQVWSYTGMDFESEAKEALERLQQKS